MLFPSKEGPILTNNTNNSSSSNTTRGRLSTSSNIHLCHTSKTATRSNQNPPNGLSSGTSTQW